MIEERYRFGPAPTIPAGWLICRLPRTADAGALFAAAQASAGHLAPWMPWARDYTREVADQWIEKHSGHGAVADGIYLLWDRSGKLLGTSGLHARLGPGRLELGYWVDARHTRRGVATLAAAALSDFAFSLADLTAVEIHHDQANTASGVIPAKLGFSHVATTTREPDAPGEIGIEWQWQMKRSAWPTSAGAQLLARSRLGQAGTSAG